jgi:RNA polymerase-binding transcription factor DksA
MDQSFVEEMQRRIEQERASVREQLADYDADPEENGAHLDVNEGFADSAQATAERSEALGKIEQLRSHYRELTLALRRIEEGSYGKCERCGQDIPVERLEAIPATRLCVSCKQAVGAR